ncbi:hypothetical protein ScPMuIL_005769 [Solemya velum]
MCILKLLAILCGVSVCFSSQTPTPDENVFYNETNGYEYNPKGPMVLCSYLPLEFLKCEQPEDLNGNETQRQLLGYGCTKWGGERYEDVQHTAVWCEALPLIECFGDRRFLREDFPCIKYNGYYFVTTLIYSVLLGFLGMDRFCLGHTGTGVGKLLTLGGLGKMVAIGSLFIEWFSERLMKIMSAAD